MTYYHTIPSSSLLIIFLLLLLPEEEQWGTRVVDTVRVHEFPITTRLLRSPLSQQEHLRLLQRYKRIMEADDYREDDTAAVPLLYTEL